jgi:phosphate acetyltransferase
LVPDRNEPYTVRLNIDIANNLDAEVILVAAPEQMSCDELDQHLKIAAGQYAAPEDPDVIGVVLNKVGQPDRTGERRLPLTTELPKQAQIPDLRTQCSIFSEQFRLLGQIPWTPRLSAPRVVDLAQAAELDVINAGEMELRRVLKISVCARTVPNLLQELAPGHLLVTPSDRIDVLIAAAIASLNGVPLAGIVLTGGEEPNEAVRALCHNAFQSGLSVLMSRADTLPTVIRLANTRSEVPKDDVSRMEDVVSFVAEHLDLDWFKDHCRKVRATRLSPPAFRYQLSERARAANKTIVLPEGNEPRTVAAATICHQRGLARCVMIGKIDEIRAVAQSQGLTLPEDVRVIDPDAIRDNYVAPMVELRRNKGMTPQMALAMLEDNVVLATMMVALNEVDGLVSGAVHTTANTVRPALQLIKTHPGARVVSSVFFMCLPEQVLVYGDCAINPDPNAEELADIAIQSAESALTFGIEPKIAMISYSTGKSGSGSDVDKVREATRIAKALRPDLIIDGPLQYDAAAIESVARTKAPDSPVAGKATVFIFPDLNTGNTTYKAVQRSANVISVGPMLQGLKKPVNDLSRGALIEDIVFTIALTAVQATQVEGR